MGGIYKSPLRVYLLLALLALWGVLSGISLPISLFPNSSKPTIWSQVPYGDLTADEFSRTYGTIIESQLRAVLVDGHAVENLTANYHPSSVEYTIEFEWDTPGDKALREVRTLMAALSGAWSEESRLGYNVEYWSQNSGFLALSFYSPLRPLDELYDQLKPLVDPLASRVHDASEVGLYNPKQKHVEIDLDPERLAALHLVPADIENAIRSFNNSLTGGNLQVGEKKITVAFPRSIENVDDLRDLPVYTRGNVRVQLKDVGDVQLMTDTKSSTSFKTSGVPSLILFASPKPGGNIKKMSDDIMSEINKIKPQLPSDVEFKILVNPSEFIDSSVKSVLKEVGVAAFLAVLILLLFIGSFKNVATAAIEIPMSIVLAFIFMKFFNMNLNLISLGGLALSAGMNVDASVVVMENIFRHFELAPPNLNADQRLRVLLDAVKEVWSPVVASTIASLVVFIPLIMTSGLTNSILGDLAKAVVFSHSMSAIVALVLVPTVRLQMMRTETHFHLQSPIEKQFVWLESTYARLLGVFLRRSGLQLVAYGAVVVALAGLLILVLPRLPKEIIGRPETDWVVLNITTPSFTEPRQLDSFVEKVEFDLSKELQDKVAYTFTQLHGSVFGQIMFRLKNVRDMDSVWKKIEEMYTNSATVFYDTKPWNPSELPIPNPPDLRWEVRGPTPVERAKVAEDVRQQLAESQIFPRISTDPDSSPSDRLVMKPNFDVLAHMEKPGLTESDLAQYVRVATEGKFVGYLTLGTKTYNMDLGLSSGRVKTVEDLKSLPVGLGAKVVPFGALTQVSLQKEPPPIYRLNQADMTLIQARVNQADKALAGEKQAQARNFLDDWKAKHSQAKANVIWTEPDIDIQTALEQLKWALAISVLLIFVTMVLQFGDMVNALLVLVAIPLGMIGVLSSLFIFHSTLSLNSVLGMILLNGIAVANSIILVDFMKKKVDAGLSPNEAAVEASRARLRPILMTSLTTVLGMLPIALGFGEGGRILQPLGIAVAGGLWISMLLTLFLVPALQAGYLNWRQGHLHRHPSPKRPWTGNLRDLQ